MNTTKKKQRKIDWDAIKTEYVTTDISQPKLIKKYRLSKGAVNKHSKDDGWVEARKVYREKMVAKAVEKSCNKEANALASLLDSSYKMRDVIANALNDPYQFNRHLVTKGSKGGEFYTEEEIMEKVDTKAMREMTQALKAVEGLIRSLGSFPTEAEAQRLQLEREKFELEKEKWEKEKAEQSAAHEVKITFETDDMEGWTE